jgi:tripartite-type tricarboxylate transporter receptor subunit TctC
MHKANGCMFFAMILAVAISTPAAAQRPAATPAKDYPSKTIRFVVPYPSGGGLDDVGRNLILKLIPAVGQNIVLDNRGGAGGVIGSEMVARSAPDGYTLLLNSSSHISVPFFMKSVPYDPVHDFTPVTLVAKSVGHVLVVNNSLPARSVKEFIALAKAHPGKLNYGSAGNGNVLHLAGEIFSRLADVKMIHVPYKGVANAMTDLIGGQIEVCFPAASTALPFIRAGRVRALVTTGTHRWSQLPEVPTLEELGFKGAKFYAWYGLWFPVGTPAAYVTYMQNEVAKTAKDADLRQRYEQLGLEAVGSTAHDFEQTINEDFGFYKKLTASMGVVPQ